MPYKISVITPTRNMGRFLETCILGVLMQDYPNFEHIVVDGDSQDNTREILKRYPHVKWVSEPDRGLSDALNKGIRMAAGDIIACCNADDCYLPGAFKVASAHYDHRPETMLLYGDYREVDVEGRPFSIKREIDFDLFILRYLHVNYIAPPAAFWRKELHDRGFWFDESLHFAMDYDFLLRVALSGYRFSHVPTLLADFRRHPGTKSSSSEQAAEHLRIVRNQNRLLCSSPARLASILRAFLCRCARTKRTYLRAVRGHYHEQWWHA
jgi:glycosyltransferase involved in cell wall biosynthesis